MLAASHSPFSSEYMSVPTPMISCLADARVIVLSRIYGADALAHHNYSRILSSVAFAGTIVGMLTFGE
jgi:hypothetical protein